MRFSSILLSIIAACCLAGCDRAAPPAEQAQAEAAVAKETAATRGSFGLESASGMKALLSYEFAGSQIPDAVFRGADGRQLTLADFQGRPLLVNIWATWCAPCKAEMPTLDALAALEEGQLSVVVISQDLQGRQPVSAFFASTGIQNLEPFIDPENNLSAAFDNRLTLPTTLLYDSAGREVWRVIGAVEWDDEEMAGLIDEAA